MILLLLTVGAAFLSGYFIGIWATIRVAVEAAEEAFDEWEAQR